MQKTAKNRPIPGQLAARDQSDAPVNEPFGPARFRVAVDWALLESRIEDEEEDPPARGRFGLRRAHGGHAGGTDGVGTGDEDEDEHEVVLREPLK